VERDLRILSEPHGDIVSAVRRGVVEDDVQLLIRIRTNALSHEPQEIQRRVRVGDLVGSCFLVGSNSTLAIVSWTTAERIGSIWTAVY